MYADLIAQCVYSTIIYAYPNSWVSFDEAFKTELCLYITLWQVGTKPLPKCWIKWELRLLEPLDLPKCKAQDDNRPGVKSVGSFDFDELLKNARIKAANEEFQRKLKAMQQQYEGKRLSVMEVKGALSKAYSRHHDDDFKQRASTHCSTDGTNKLGVAMEQLEALQKRAMSKVQLLVPSELPSRSTSPARPRSQSTSPHFPEKHQHSGQHDIRHVSVSAPPKPLRRASSPDPYTRRGSSPKPQVRKGSSSTEKSKQSRLSGQRASIASTRKGSSPRSDLDRGGTRSPLPKTTAESTCSRRADASSPVPNRKGTSPVPAENKKSLSPNAGAAKRMLPRPSSPWTSRSRPASGRSDYTRYAQRRAAVIDLEQTTTAIGAPLVPVSHSNKYDGLKRMSATFKKRPESATLRGPEFEHVLFNVYGHSPLVKHYMQQMNLSHVNEKEIVVGRTEISEEPPQNAVCYRDVLIESKVATDSNREQFLKYVSM
jgi:hypothetical protein